MINLHTKFEVSMFAHYEDMKGNTNVEFGVIWGVKGYPRSLAMSPFNRMPMTSHSTFDRNYAVLCHFEL